MGLVGPRPYFMLWGFIFLKGMKYNIMHILKDENFFYSKILSEQNYLKDGILILRYLI